MNVFCHYLSLFSFAEQSAAVPDLLANQILSTDSDSNIISFTGVLVKQNIALTIFDVMMTSTAPQGDKNVCN